MAMADCIPTAIGRSASPASSEPTFSSPGTDPRNPISASITAPCMACLHRDSAKARMPRISSGTPMKAGMSAVMLTMSLAT
jgi:hypothetical protein